MERRFGLQTFLLRMWVDGTFLTLSVGSQVVESLYLRLQAERKNNFELPKHEIYLLSVQSLKEEWRSRFVGFLLFFFWRSHSSRSIRAGKQPTNAINGVAPVLGDVI